MQSEHGLCQENPCRQVGICRCSASKLFWTFLEKSQENHLQKNILQLSLQLYWNSNLWGVFFYEFSKPLLNRFSTEHLWMTVSENNCKRVHYVVLLCTVGLYFTKKELFLGISQAFGLDFKTFCSNLWSFQNIYIIATFYSYIWTSSYKNLLNLSYKFFSMYSYKTLTKLVTFSFFVLHCMM